MLYIALDTLLFHLIDKSDPYREELFWVCSENSSSAESFVFRYSHIAVERIVMVAYDSI